MSHPVFQHHCIHCLGAVASCRCCVHCVPVLFHLLSQCCLSVVLALLRLLSWRCCICGVLGLLSVVPWGCCAHYSVAGVPVRLRLLSWCGGVLGILGPACLLRPGIDSSLLCWCILALSVGPAAVGLGVSLSRQCILGRLLLLPGVVLVCSGGCVGVSSHCCARCALWLWRPLFPCAGGPVVLLLLGWVVPFVVWRCPFVSWQCVLGLSPVWGAVLPVVIVAVALDWLSCGSPWHPLLPPGAVGLVSSCGCVSFRVCLCLWVRRLRPWPVCVVWGV